MRSRALSARLALALLAGVPALTAWLAPAASSSAAGGRSLSGTFRLAPGRFAAGHASGSYFRMIFPGGAGKYFINPDSQASDRTFTLIRPGSAGGLVSGRFQPDPRPAFDGQGNSRARAIIRPQAFAGIRFSLTTLPTDPQSHRRVAAPSFQVSGTRLTARLQALTAEWNRQYFNQGSPKPGASGPPAAGTYSASSRSFVLQWTSLIKGGPFNGFTGYWHLQGTVRPGH